MQINYIFTAGLQMLGIALISMACAIGMMFLANRVGANLGKSLREKVFKKVQQLGIAEIKKFSTSSLITRTTNDVTQIEMLLAMGLQVLIKAPIMAIWAVSKIINKSATLSGIVAVGVVVLLITVLSIMFVVTPKFTKIQKLTDKVNTRLQC